MCAENKYFRVIVRMGNSLRWIGPSRGLNAMIPSRLGVRRRQTAAEEMTDATAPDLSLMGRFINDVGPASQQDEGINIKPHR